MRKSNHGAVSMALITFILLTLIFAGASYWLYTEREAALAQRDDIAAEYKETQTQLQNKIEDFNALKDEKEALRNELIATENEAKSAKNRLETIKNLNEDLKNENERLITKHREQLDNKENYISELRTERSQLKSQKANLEAQFKNSESSFIKKIEKLEEEKQALKEKQREVLSTKNTAIRQLETRIKELIGRKEKWLTTIETDGEVLTANNDKGFVSINIGNKENLKPGIKFEVFQIRGGGKYVPKGLIEIKEVQEGISFGHIISIENITNPIIPGDFVGSPVFDKNEKKSFYVAGDFEKYKQEDIKKLIKETGGEIVDEVDIYTDFVILGKKNSGLAKNKAIDVGVKMMNETQLLRYLMD